MNRMFQSFWWIIKPVTFILFRNMKRYFRKKLPKQRLRRLTSLKNIFSIFYQPFPLFLLGVFNYNHDIWAYDWLYIDTEGKITDSIGTYNFKVLDQIGDLVWPDRKMILPDQYIGKNWKFGKINAYEGMQDNYLIRIEDEKQLRTMGLWNSSKKIWEIKPDYHHISVLDTEKQIYALQKEQDGPYMLFDNKTHKNIGSKAYQSINSDGWVNVQLPSGQTINYYIDIYSGKEYKE